MSQDLTVNLAAEVPEAAILAFVAETVTGAEVTPTSVRRDGLNVYVESVDPEDVALLGVRARTVVVMQVLTGVSRDVYDATQAFVVRLALRCLDRFGDGVALVDYNETVVVLRRGAVTTRNTLWPGWTDHPASSDLVATLPGAALTGPGLTGWRERA